MKGPRCTLGLVVALGSALVAAAGAGCSDGDPGAGPVVPGEHPITLMRRFPVDAQPGVSAAGCTFASPLPVDGANGTALLVAASDGTLAAVDAVSGVLQWRVTLPAPAGEQPILVATPVIAGGHAFVAYHTIAAGAAGAAYDVRAPRRRHRLAAVDLALGAVDDAFPPFDFAAAVPGNDGATISFLPAHAMARGELVHVRPAGATLGRVYVSFGNVQDLQPWHGWLFAVDLDAWHAGGAPIAATLLTTPEGDCGPENSDGARGRRCGGGLWGPAGPLVVDDGSGADPTLIIAPGNGETDLGRHDFANTLMRLPLDLAFDSGCDAAACADFRVDDPAPACAASCRNLYIPRLAPGEQPELPESGACDQLGLYDCWGRMDYADGSTPVRLTLADGRHVLVYATKDGVVSLVDADQLGVLYDRRRIVAICGTRDDECDMDWAGMIVTQPALAQRGSDPLIIVPTFMADHSHDAGVFALGISDDGSGPRLTAAWQHPAAGSDEARRRFRRHPSRATVAAPLGGESYAFVVEVVPGGQGQLLALRVADGTLAASATLTGPGMRFIRPAVHGDTVYVTSCDSDSGPGHVEAYQLIPNP
jgi:outer membrane protein assembly factor BamB